MPRTTRGIKQTCEKGIAMKTKNLTGSIGFIISVLLLLPGTESYAAGNSDERDAIRPFQINIPKEARRGHAQTHRGDAVARKRDCRRSIARRAARDDAETRALLGDGLRLAQVRGEAQRAAAIHHNDRWIRHSFHSRSVEGKERVADHHHARLARFDHRADEDHRPADRSGCPWRKG